MMTRYERRCLTLLRAYPARYRAARGDELMATLLDAATPGRDIPSVRESWDVIRGGLSTRWRAHPPVWHWLLYRAVGKRLPFSHRWWARDDILGRWYYLRDDLGRALFFSPLMLSIFAAENGIFTIIYGDPYRSPLPRTGEGWLWFLLLLTAVILIPIRRRARRRAALKKHEFFPDGTPFEAAAAWGPPWPPVVSPVAVHARRPEPPDGGASLTSGPWPPPE